MSTETNELIAELVQQARKAISSAGPAVWQAESQGFHNSIRQSYAVQRSSASTDAGSVPSIPFSTPGAAAAIQNASRGGVAVCGRPEARDVVARLDAALREPGDDRCLTMEVAIDADGAADFTYTFDLEPVAVGFSHVPELLYQVLLDGEYRLPGNPPAHSPRPATAEPSDRPTDPAVLREVSALVDEFVEHHQRIRGRKPSFGEPIEEAELAEAERRMGVRLPEDVRALYRRIGHEFETGLLANFTLYPLDMVVNCHAAREGSWNERMNVFDDNRVVMDAEPAGAVRRVPRSDWWIVLGRDFGCNFWGVDLDPGPAGTVGQILEYGRDLYGPVALIAPSVTARLADVVEALRNDRLCPDEEDLEDDEDDDRCLLADLPDPVADHNVYKHHEKIGSQPLEALLRHHPDPTKIQELHLRDAQSLDLRALTVTPNLRELHINGAESVDLWLPEQVESLQLAARHADLSRLAGHPTLWDLSVYGLDVRVEDLAALPAVRRLDLADARVDRLEDLADLDIRVLVLNADQWLWLRLAGRVPRNLAAAQFRGNTGLPEAKEWAAWLRATR